MTKIKLTNATSINENSNHPIQISKENKQNERKTKKT